ncbi:MAG TPA: hypothetical protein VK167_15300 [Flavipsychrobacter sp.]|nr:hypothetical protein [Flavipsychrobacter sp.]
MSIASYLIILVPLIIAFIERHKKIFSKKPDVTSISIVILYLVITICSIKIINEEFKDATEGKENINQIKKNNERLLLSNASIDSSSRIILANNEQLKEDNKLLQRKLDSCNKYSIAYIPPSTQIRNTVIQNLKKLKQKYKTIPYIKISSSSNDEVITKMKNDIKYFFNGASYLASYDFNTMVGAGVKSIIIFSTYKNVYFAEDLVKSISPYIHSFSGNNYYFINLHVEHVTDEEIYIILNNSPVFTKTGEVIVQ